MITWLFSFKRPWLNVSCLSRFLRGFFLFPFTRLSSVRNNSSESFDKLIKRARDANEVRYANASASYRLSTDAAGARANQTRKFITQLVEWFIQRLHFSDRDPIDIQVIRPSRRIPKNLQRDATFQSGDWDETAPKLPYGKVRWDGVSDEVETPEGSRGTGAKLRGFKVNSSAQFRACAPRYPRAFRPHQTPRLPALFHRAVSRGFKVNSSAQRPTSTNLGPTAWTYGRTKAINSIQWY